MKTKYKYIEFVSSVGHLTKRTVWTLIDRRTKRGALGTIHYEPRWRQWATAIGNCVPGYELTAKYHRDIADFLEQLNREGKT